MFSAILVATALATLQADDPVARLARYMDGATHYLTTFTVADGKGVKFAEGSWELARPLTQRLKAKSGGYSFEFIQTPEATLSYIHHKKEYMEWPAFTELAPPPPENKLLEIAYPSFLLHPQGLRRFKWSAPKSVEINGKKVDEIDAVEKGQAEVTVHLFVDDVGRVARFYVKTVGMMGTTEYTTDFTSHERVATIENSISARLIDGYVPYNVGPARQTVTAPEPAPATTVYDAAGKAATKLDFAGKPTVVVFTAPDCDVSKAMRSALAKAVSAYGKEARFVEVSLGQEKPASPLIEGAPQYWDKDGKAEKAWGINYTPYVLVVKNGVVNRGFGGYGPDQEAAFLSTVAAAVESKD
ncbi:MAG: thioredoxin family protein [Fimbriimonadaceae bacterium]|nr:thioredoxin family protein [Fimbriimonadaceae bacterium]